MTASSVRPSGSVRHYARARRNTSRHFQRRDVERGFAVISRADKKIENAGNRRQAALVIPQLQTKRCP